MPVITITSDFGFTDYYVAVIKGALLSEDERLRFIDITHNIQPYDILQGAFIFRNTWKSFPAGSIHLLSINDYYSREKRFLAIRQEGHFFLGPDNGLFSLIFGTTPEEVYELPFPEESSFALKEIFASAVRHILGKEPFETIGPPAGEIVQRITFQPVIGPSHIRGTVIHIDNYGNAIVNISRELFTQVGQEREFALFFRRHDPITQLSRNYYDVPVGEPLCLFNSAGFIEIAINMGEASSLLGLQLEDTVQVDFK